jgi:hypothetical protein
MYRIYDHIQSNSVTKERQGLCCVTVTYFVAYVKHHLGKRCKMQGFECLKKAVNNISRASDAPLNACANSVPSAACVRTCGKVTLGAMVLGRHTLLNT